MGTLFFLFPSRWSEKPNPKSWKASDFDSHQAYYRILRDREHRGRGAIIIKTSGDPEKLLSLWKEGLKALREKVPCTLLPSK